MNGKCPHGYRDCGMDEDDGQRADFRVRDEAKPRSPNAFVHSKFVREGVVRVFCSRICYDRDTLPSGGS